MLTMSESKNSFIAIPMSEFSVGLPCPVDLYVQLSLSKYVLVVRRGERPDQDRFDQFRDRNLTHLWVTEDEYQAFTKQIVLVAGVAVLKKNFSNTLKTKFLANAATSVFREFETIGLTAENYEFAKDINQSTLSLIDSQTSFQQILDDLNQCSDDVVKHSMAVSVLSVLISSQLGWESKINIEKVSLGAMLIDIGLKQLPKETVSKPIMNMTPEEVFMYETHPFRGMEMCLLLGNVPDDVVSIIYEHEENIIGQGYPRRIRAFRMHPMARVVSLANAYVRLVLPTKNNPVPKNHREALVYIEHTQGQPHDKEAFSALITVVTRQKLKAS